MNHTKTSLRQIATLLLAALFCGLTMKTCGAASDYFSLLNPPGTGYDENGSYWNATSETATPLAANVIGDLMVIGTNANDFYGSNYTINLDEGGDLSGGGITIGATNTVITFIGTANTHFTAADTITVAAGSELIMDVTHDGGFNFNSETTTFAGGGTIYFEDLMCANDSALITENMTGAGTVIVGHTSVGSFGTPSGGYTLTAGTLDIFTAFAANTIFTNFGAGKFFSINGGTIDNTSGSPLTLKVGLNGTTGKYSIGGNFTFNGSSSLDFGIASVTNTANHTINIVANTLAIGGTISGPGNGLTLVGNGTLSLYGASTYTGNTLVLGGTLALTNAGSLSSGTQIIVSNATFDVTGLAGNYTGTTPIGMTNGTFNLSNTLATAISTLSLSNSALNVAVSSATVTNVLATTLNVGGTTNIVNFVSIPLVTSYPQVFTIVQGTTVNGTLNFGLGTVPTSPTSTPFGGYITNVAASGSVQFVLTNGPMPVLSLVWSGLDGGVPNSTWDIGTTPTWLNGGTPSVFNDLDFVRFDDMAAGSLTVNMAADLQPGGLIVSNNAVTYAFTGGSLSDPSTGPLTLVKQGTGTLLLQESGDNFSGGIQDSAGTVIIDNDSSSIQGGANIGVNGTIQMGTNDTATVNLPSGTATVNGNLVFNSANNLTLPNGITGNGTVNQIDTNIVTLADSGGSSGNWTVNIQNGTLQAADNTALGSLPGGSVTITNGGTFDLGANTTQNNANFGAKQFNIAGAGVGGNGVIINSASSQQQDAFENVVLTANATIGGSPNATLGNDAYRWDIRGGTPLLNLGGFTLTKTNVSHTALVSAHITSGNIVIQQGILSIEVTPNFDPSAGTITVNSGGILAEYEDTLGSFTRGIVLNGGENENLAGAGTTTYLDAPILLETNATLVAGGGTEYYDGVISDGGAGFGITQTGTGTNILTATNTYSGATYIGQGTLWLTNHGSIASSALIWVTNGAALTISSLAVPFSGPSALVLGDDTLGVGTLNFSSSLITNLNYFSISNAVLNLAVANNASGPAITVTNLNLGDGGASSTINITVLPVLSPPQFPLIKYSNVTGNFNNLSLGNLPNGYNGTLVNDTANSSIDLSLTTVPAGVWNGGDSAVDNDWSDPLNWRGTGLTGNDALYFTGVAGLNNTNDLGFTETANGITFVPGAGAFTLNSNAVVLAGGITNSSANPQTIDLGLDFGANGTNYTFVGGSSPAAPLIIGGGLTNTFGAPGYTILNLAGYGILTNLLNSTVSPGGTNVIELTNNSANWTLADNATSSTNTQPWGFVIFGGTFNYGTVGHTNGPNLVSTPGNAALAGDDTFVGDGTNNIGTFNMVNGSLTLYARLDTGTSITGSTGIVTQTGGNLTVNGQFQGANIGGGVSTVSLSGGTFNVVGNTTFVASRGTGTFTVGGSAVANLGLLDVSRGIGLPTVGVVNLNAGGTLAVSEISTATANAASPVTGASANFNFNGGLLQATGNNTSFITNSSEGVVSIPLALTVQSGGAIINNAGFAITVTSPMVSGANPDGGLTTLGTGALTLTAANSYNGNTTISNGTLVVNGSLAPASVVNVTPSGTLSGNGTVGGVVTVNGTLTPGNPGTNGLLTCSSNVTLNGAALMKLNNLTNDTLAVGRTLAYGGTLIVTNLAGTPVLGNSFQLFTAGAFTGNFAATNLPPLGGGLGWNWNPANGTLSVISVVNPNPTNIVATLSGNILTLTWPSDHTGWILQAQTNSLGSGLNATAGAWVSVPNSTTTNAVSITIDPTQPTVFYRLQFP